MDASQVTTGGTIQSEAAAACIDVIDPSAPEPGTQVAFQSCMSCDEVELAFASNCI